jgi:hypothetical protein
MTKLSLSRADLMIAPITHGSVRSGAFANGRLTSFRPNYGAKLCSISRPIGPAQFFKHKARRQTSFLQAAGVGAAEDDVPITELQRRLEDAIDEENYTAAARLRDEIE